jgi:gas vesicle protein
MGQDPDEIRQEIEQTRAEMGETVEAIGYKADVPSRAKEAVAGKAESVKSRISDTASRAKEAVTGTTSRAGEDVSEAASRVGDATPSGRDVKRTARRAAGLAQENPLGMAIGALALGFLAGLAAPTTRVEDEKLGPVADQVKDKVQETGQEALERGRDVAEQATQSAVDTARQQGQQQGEELAESARQSADDIRDQARQRTRSRTRPQRS